MIEDIDIPVVIRGKEEYREDTWHEARHKEAQHRKAVEKIEKSYLVDKPLKEAKEQVLKEKDEERKESGMIARKKYAVALDEPLPAESYANVLPLQAVNHYGCVRCDWRGTWKCPYGFKSGRGYVLKDNMHVAGICTERKNYLLSFSRGYVKRPSFAVWHKDFLVGQAAHQVSKDGNQMEEIEAQLHDLLSSPPMGYKDYQDATKPIDKEAIKVFKAYERQIQGLKVDLMNKRKEWHGLWKDVVAVEDKQIDRETPKKLEVEHHRTIPLSQMHAIMRGDAVDAEFEEVDTEGNASSRNEEVKDDED